VRHNTEPRQDGDKEDEGERVGCSNCKKREIVPDERFRIRIVPDLNRYGTEDLDPDKDQGNCRNETELGLVADDQPGDRGQAEERNCSVKRVRGSIPGRSGLPVRQWLDQ